MGTKMDSQLSYYSVGPSLARVFLASTPAENHNALVRDLAKGLGLGDTTTTALVIQLVTSIGDTEARCLLEAHLVKELQHGNPREVARLCVQSHDTTKWLLSHIMHGLQEHLHTVQHVLGDNGFVGNFPESSSIDANFKEPKVEKDSLSSSGVEHSALVVLPLLQCLSYLSLQGSHEAVITISASLLSRVLNSLLHVDTPVVMVARDALYAILEGLRTGHVVLGDGGDQQLLSCWQTIELLLKSETKSLYRSTAYQLWARILSSRSGDEMLAPLLNHDMYWANLQEALISGDMEQRKTSLHILRLSLAIAKTHRYTIKTSHLAINTEASPKGMVISNAVVRRPSSSSHRGLLDSSRVSRIVYIGLLTSYRD